VFAGAFLFGIAAKAASLAVSGRAGEPVMMAKTKEPNFWTGFKAAMPRREPIGAKDRKARDRSLQFGLSSRTLEIDQLMRRTSDGRPGGDSRYLTYDQAAALVDKYESVDDRFAEVFKREQEFKNQMALSKKTRMETHNESMKEHERSQAANLAAAKASSEANEGSGAGTGFADPPRVKWNYDASGILGGMPDTLAAKMFSKLGQGLSGGRDAITELNEELASDFRKGQQFGPINPYAKMKADADDLEEYVGKPDPKDVEGVWPVPGTGLKGLVPNNNSGPLPWEA